jgi:hypothetical protein
MPIIVRRKNNLRNQMLTLILLSVLAGIVGGTLVGFATGHHSSSSVAAGSNS